MATPPPDCSEPSSRRTMAGGLRPDPNWHAGLPRVAENYNVPLIYRAAGPARHLVSGNRARCNYQNIDLDLAYITDRIIAVGYPASGFEALYRNSLAETREFLFRRHGLHRVKVFNLRGGYFYDPTHFDSNVICFDMKDHHPPSLELMAPFCREAKEWLDADPKNVIAVHCKAGKGRTGVMICALLIYIDFYNIPRQILDYYSIIRTKNNKGVTIPSQRRYIYYYHTLRQKQLNYLPLRMQLMGIYVERPPQTSGGGSHFKIVVTNNSADVFTPPALSISRDNYRKEKRAWRSSQDPGFEEDSDPTKLDSEGKRRILVSKRAYCFMVPEDSPVFVEGDVRVDLRESGFGLFSRFPSKKIGHVWFNTMFVCHGEPLGEEFVYGDKRWPYNGSDTSIGRLNGMIGDEVPLPKRDSVHQNPWNIVQPPKLNIHSPLRPLYELYGQYGMPAPRDHIAAVLHDMHKEGKVKDEYNDRRKDIVRNSYVALGNRGEIKNVGGPFQIPRNDGEHILTFPVYEVDRALKTHKIDNGMKMHVVLKCVDAFNETLMAKSEAFCNMMYHVEETQNAQAVHQRSARYPPRQPDFGVVGAEMKYPPVVRYAKGDTYDGSCHVDLKTDQFANRKIASTKRYCRYFYRQRDTSASRYPEPVHECPLTLAHFKIPHDGYDSNNDSNNGSQPKNSPHPGPSTTNTGPSASSAGQPGPAPSAPRGASEGFLEQRFPKLPSRQPQSENEEQGQVPESHGDGSRFPVIPVAFPSRPVGADPNKGETNEERTLFLEREIRELTKGLREAENDVNAEYYPKRAVDIMSPDYSEKEPLEDPESEFRKTTFPMGLEDQGENDQLRTNTEPDSSVSPNTVDHLSGMFSAMFSNMNNKAETEAADSQFNMKKERVETEMDIGEWFVRVYTESDDTTRLSAWMDRFESLRKTELERLEALHGAPGTYMDILARRSTYPQAEVDERTVPEKFLPPKPWSSSFCFDRSTRDGWAREYQKILQA